MKHSASISVVFLLVLAHLAVATAASAAAAMDGAANYLVYVDRHPRAEEKEKAKAVILYNYKNVMSGFSARLTPSELEAVKKQPQVNRVLPSVTLSLMSSKFDGVS
ncbi:unnamed protein product [Urochloa decumbens]|uniref:Inhibitor I9 domain-containing protein n=1 Tax=Urochloa decumbens TaxID=240449 RepID=A0ABC8XNF2_9POAL